MTKVFHSFCDVCLRDWEPNDVEKYAELVGDPQVMKFIGNGATRDLTTAGIEIERFRQEIATRGWSRWAVSKGPNGPLMGYVGYAEKADGIDLGIRFLRQYWGSPYPYISGCLALEYGFEKICFEQMYCVNDVNNKLAVKLVDRIARIAPFQVETPQGLYNRYEMTRETYYEKGIHTLNRIDMERLVSRMTRSNKAEAA